MPLDPQVQVLLEQLAAMNMPASNTLTPNQLRQNSKARGTTGKPEPVGKVEDRQVPGPLGDIPVRIYSPQGDGPFPLLVFFHGGGFVTCDIETHDELCRSLTNQAGCITVSVEYRLAPENKFPAAPQDCYAATQWVAANASNLNGDPSHLAVGGDSAGGNLTAVVAQMARDLGSPALTFQLLIYPSTDLTKEFPSLIENGKGYLLTKESMDWCNAHYLNNDEDKKNLLASPGLAANLSGLPAALIITAEFDPLRDDGEHYGKLLKEAGVPVIISRYNGMIHGFLSMAAFLDQGKQGITEASQALKAAFKTLKASA